jgi:hypothetical protein
MLQQQIKNRIYNNYNVNDFYDYHIDSFQSSDSKMLYNHMVLLLV